MTSSYTFISGQGAFVLVRVASAVDGSVTLLLHLDQIGHLLPGADPDGDGGLPLEEAA